jgi:hypothetical protein
MLLCRLLLAWTSCAQEPLWPGQAVSGETGEQQQQQRQQQQQQAERCIPKWAPDRKKLYALALLMVWHLDRYTCQRAGTYLLLWQRSNCARLFMGQRVMVLVWSQAAQTGVWRAVGPMHGSSTAWQCKYEQAPEYEWRQLQQAVSRGDTAPASGAAAYRRAFTALLLLAVLLPTGVPLLHCCC